MSLALLMGAFVFNYAKQRIRSIISDSQVPEDPRHADNTLKWLCQLQPDADEALQLAALAHDIDRANAATKIQRADYDDYDAFKAAHAYHGAEILRPLLVSSAVPQDVIEEACRLVVCHEVGGDPRSNVLKDADSISYFDVNLPLYYQREGWDETKRRSAWGYARLSSRARAVVNTMDYEKGSLTRLMNEIIDENSRVPP